jgi:hypothetical protein
MFRIPLLAAAAVTGTALLAAACGPAGHNAGGGVSTPATSAAGTPSQPSIPAGTVPATAVPVTSASPTATIAPVSAPAAAASACAALATRTYLHLTAVTAGTAGALTVTGNPARLICGGPDDSHYDVGTASATGQLAAGASIVTFSLTTMSPKAIGESQLAAYLAGDQGTRIFLVTGPLTRITGLQEQFHP